MADISGQQDPWQESPPPAPSEMGNRRTAAELRGRAMSELTVTHASWRRGALGALLALTPAAAVFVDRARQDAADRPDTGRRTDRYVLADGGLDLAVQLGLAGLATAAVVGLLLVARRGRQIRRLLLAWDRFGFDPRARALRAAPEPASAPRPPQRGWFSWLRTGGVPPPRPPAPRPTHHGGVWRPLRPYLMFLASIVFALAGGILTAALVITVRETADRSDTVMSSAMLAAALVSGAATLWGCASVVRSGGAIGGVEGRSGVAAFLARARTDLAAGRTSTPDQLEHDEQMSFTRHLLAGLPLTVPLSIGVVLSLVGSPWGVWVGVFAPFAAPAIGWYVWSRWRRRVLPGLARRRGLVAPDVSALLARSIRDDSRDHQRPHAPSTVDVPDDVLDAVPPRTYVVQAAGDAVLLVHGRRRIAIGARTMLGAAVVPGSGASRLDVALLWPQGETLILSGLQREGLLDTLHAAGVALAPLDVEGFEDLLSANRAAGRAYVRHA